MPRLSGEPWWRRAGLLVAQSFGGIQMGCPVGRQKAKDNSDQQRYSKCHQDGSARDRDLELIAKKPDAQWDSDSDKNADAAASNADQHGFSKELFQDFAPRCTYRH